MTAKNITTELTYELAHEFLEADFETGILTWKTRHRKWFKNNRLCNAWNAKLAGIQAGCIVIHNKKKYYQIVIFNKCYLMHRVIFLMAYGFFPIEIDHIDGNGLNNMHLNLRNVNRQENNKNQRIYVNNTSGYCGVSWHKASKKWLVRIGVNGKPMHLGTFTDWFEAICSRKSAENKYNYHRNHGQSK